MSVRYFHHKLTFHEANDYIAGLQRRRRAGWEQARLLADVIARCAGNENGLDISFPWDDELTEEQDDEQWMEGFAERAEKLKEKLRNNG